MTPSISATLQRHEIRLLMAFVIGFGLATLMREPCKGYMCRRFVAPDLKEVSTQVWRHGSGCVKVRLHSTPCGDHKGRIIPSA